MHLHEKRKRGAGHRTYISLPGKLDQDPTYNHAKGGEARTIFMSRCKTFERDISPFGIELLSAICERREREEWGWVSSIAYEQLAYTFKVLGISSQALRITAVNHNERLLGSDEQTKRCGHTERTRDINYKDDDFAISEEDDERPESLEASLELDPRLLRKVLSRVKNADRSAWNAPRAIPAVTRRDFVRRADSSAPRDMQSQQLEE